MLPVVEKGHAKFVCSTRSNSNRLLSLIIHILPWSFNWDEEGSQNYKIQIPNKPYGLTSTVCLLNM